MADHEGYVASGRLLADATRWAWDPTSCYRIEPPARDPAVFADRLAEPHQEAFLALTRLLRAGELPRWHHFRPDHGSFGLELCEGDHAWRVDRLQLLGDRRRRDRARTVFPLATDGAFRLFVLLEDGTVGPLDQEGQGIVSAWFDSLDAYLWADVRLSAAPAHLSRREAARLLEAVEGAEEYVEELLEEV